MGKSHLTASIIKGLYGSEEGHMNASNGNASNTASNNSRRTDLDDLFARMDGHWEGYFASRFADDGGHLDVESKQGVPCHICGGDDRFSWTNYKGRGGYHCRGGGEPHWADGLGYATELFRQSGAEIGFRSLIHDIECYLSDSPRIRPRPSGTSTGTPSDACPQLTQEFTKIAGVARKRSSRMDVLQHEYFRRKDMSEAGVFIHPDVGVYGETIVVPYSSLDDIGGKVVGAERIYPDGRKMTVKGSSKGVYRVAEGETLLLVEGYATGLALAYHLRTHGLLGRFGVLVCGGKHLIDRALAHLPNALAIRENDGDNPEGLVFPVTDAGNDPADWFRDQATVGGFINNLMQRKTND